MIIDCVADLHGYYPHLDGGDLLIVSGDLTARDTLTQHSDVLEWLHKLDYKKKIVISGNHDNFLQSNPNFYSKTNIDYLCDSGTEFEGLKIWGSPWTKTFEGMNPKCKAFTFDTEEELDAKWALIPDYLDILITHSPPFGIQDAVANWDGTWLRTGSPQLSNHLRRIAPKLHVFGHIHEGHGMCRPNLGFIDLDGYPIYVNASYVDEYYKPVNRPIRITL